MFAFGSEYDHVRKERPCKVKDEDKSYIFIRLNGRWSNGGKQRVRHRWSFLFLFRPVGSTLSTLFLSLSNSLFVYLLEYIRMTVTKLTVYRSWWYVQTFNRSEKEKDREKRVILCVYMRRMIIILNV